MPKFRKHSFVFNMFHTIDSPDKAYWLGFIFGDGSINKYGLRIELSNKDISHLYKFKIFMQFTGNIFPQRKNCSLLCLNSIILAKDLQQHLLHTPKNLVTPNIYPDLLSHFYRGFLDSDGWITTRRVNGQQDGYEYGFCCANYDFLFDIQQYFSKCLHKDKIGRLQLHKNPLGSVYQLIIGGNNQFKQLSNILYNNATYYLDRKYILMQNAITNLRNRKDLRFKINKF